MNQRISSALVSRVERMDIADRRRLYRRSASYRDMLAEQAGLLAGARP